MSATVNITIRAQVPRVPNFLLTDGKPYPVGDISDRELRAIGKLWTDALLESAQRQRANKTEASQ